MKMTEQEMIAVLHRRVERVVRLSIEVSSKGIAHCFTSYFGHTQSFDAHLHPAGTVYQEGESREYLAHLDICLYFHDFLDFDGKARIYRERAEQLDKYIETLQSLLNGQAITEAA